MSAVLPSIQIPVDFKKLEADVEDFLTHFKGSQETQLDGDVTLLESPDKVGTGLKYLNLLQSIANRAATELIIDLDDLRAYEIENNNESIVDKISKNTYHFIETFSRVVDKIMPKATVPIDYKDDVLDVILDQRRIRNERLIAERRSEMLTEEAEEDMEVDTDIFPAKLTRRYNLYFKPTSDGKKKNRAMAVRDIKASFLGQLITVRGIITRVSDVKPAVLMNAYTCDQCGFEIFQEVNSRVFTPLIECTSEQCSKNQTKGQLFMSTRASKFSAFQEVKIQELSDQVPVGHIPRMLNIHVNGDLVRSLNPGDIVDVSGIFLPSPYTGFKALRAGLLTDTYLEAQFVQQHKKKFETLLNDVIEQRISNIVAEGNIYERLAQSIAPEIFGHLDVKKALLLLLVGGVDKRVGDGMKIRGDINICLMGDPGVAKSQLLKTISKISPRGVYTTGRGSSGVGLTAAVMRDPVTDEMVLEGGALVLADNGICCIDEFDKMDESDRTAIHEVMEQQTISISKAGINTTLNARTSILAAANPLFGRYNPKASPLDNINLPAALLSRFDIMFLLLDTPSREHDERLAEHVAYVHMYSRQPETAFEPLEPSTIREFIAKAKTYRPVMTAEVNDYVVTSYIRLRQESKKEEDSRRSFGQATPRTLLGIMRLSQALAKLRFSNYVEMEDVNEALRLLQVSKSSLYQDAPDREDESPTNKIFNIIRGMAQDGVSYRKRLDMDAVKRTVMARGFTQPQLQSCVDEYKYLNIWHIIDDGATLMFVDDDGDAEMADL